MVDQHSLSKFRAERLDPRWIIMLLVTFGRVLLQLAVGVGKSEAVDRLLVQPFLFKMFSLVIYVTTQRGILAERDILKHSSKGFAFPKVLDPRPKDLCGENDSLWTTLERANCSSLGKQMICPKCKHFQNCGWHLSLSEKVRGSNVILFTEQRLIIDPLFIEKITRILCKDVHDVLVIMDEASLVTASFQRQVRLDDILRMKDILMQIQHSGTSKIREKCQNWIQCIEKLTNGDELSGNDVRSLKGISSEAEAIQRFGVEKYGQRFKFTGYDLSLIGREGVKFWLDSEKNIVIHSVPKLVDHVLVLAANLPTSLVAERLKLPSLYNPYERVKFHHSETVVYNIKSRIGASVYFPKNRKEILDFIADLTAKRIGEGKNVLLVSKKKFLAICVREIKERLRVLGVSEDILQKAGEQPKGSSPHIAVISYGVKGLNSYENYDCCFCMNSYFTSSEVLSSLVNDENPVESHAVVSVFVDSRRERQVAIMKNPSQRLDGSVYLHALEIDPVVQAIGRVRPFTRPREIVIMQLNDMSSVFHNVKEFFTIGSIRQHLGIQSPSVIARKERNERIIELHIQGLTIRAIAAHLEIGKSSVQRVISSYLKS